MNIPGDLTAALLRELLSYDSETGVFTWRTKPSPRLPAGCVAGTRLPNGYRHIKLAGRYYKAHRLAWLYVTGAWPALDIDHRNGSRDENWFNNLREATGSLNQQNRRVASRGKKSCNLLGAYRHRPGNCWHSRIRVSGRVISLGYFNTPEEAHTAYVKAKRRLHEGCTI